MVTLLLITENRRKGFTREQGSHPRRGNPIYHKPHQGPARAYHGLRVKTKQDTQALGMLAKKNTN